MSVSEPSGASALSRQEILDALRQLSDELEQEGVTGEVCLFGGTVMVLAYNAWPATKDVDALFQPADILRRLARKVALDRHLPEHWLNDGVKGYLSVRHAVTAGNLPQFPRLRLTMPVPEYLLAMKCMAARLGGPSGEQTDVPDIRFLIRHLALRDPQSVLDIVAHRSPVLSGQPHPSENAVSNRRAVRGGSGMRPRTLAEVAQLAAGGESFDRSLANFLDEFYLAPATAAFESEPPWLAPQLGELGHVQDAYLAATAEELARRFDLPAPVWATNPERALRRPWFASPLAALRAVLLSESPPAFRARNLFVSENALSRA